MDTEMKGWAPIGVVGAIVPWNFPLMLLTWKVHVLALLRTCFSLYVYTVHVEY